MTSARFLALFVAACALVASALIAIPIDGAEAPESSYTPIVPTLAAGPKNSVHPSQMPGLQGTESGDETHAALPRLWLGSPVAR
jgi:hypothetical protein